MFLRCADHALQLLETIGRVALRCRSGPVGGNGGGWGKEEKATRTEDSTGGVKELGMRVGGDVGADELLQSRLQTGRCLLESGALT